MPLKKTPGKILLFGEYTILTGGQALTIPYRNVHGYFDKLTDHPAEHHISSNSGLKKLSSYLSGLNENNFIDFKPGLVKFNNDIENGLFFHSDIPENYGVGSSGALIAAVFDQYIDNKKPGVNNLVAIRKVLATMESYFHGRSSGIDPLTCFLDASLLIAGERIEILDEGIRPGSGIFLIDTGRVATTAGLVQRFLKKNEDHAFHTAIEDELQPAVENAIRSLISGNTGFWDHIRTISEFQLGFFEEMIPENVKALWKRGCDTGDYFLKLCGSGGGGYVLGFARKHRKDVKTDQKLIWPD